MLSPVDHSHYSDTDPAVASQPALVHLGLPDLTLDLTTDRGVFSWQSIDRGTDFLLRTAPPPPASGAILDLGAGYGPIALAMAKRSPSAQVWALDVNNRALDLVRRNASAAHIGNIVACRPDGVPADLRFTAIYSNPPTHIGRDPLRELMTLWLSRLTADGNAYLVMSRHLGADSFAQSLETGGFEVDRMRSRGGYRLLHVQTAPRSGDDDAS